MESAKTTVKMFGLDFAAVSTVTAVERIIQAARTCRKKIVVTPNVDHIVTIKKFPDSHRYWSQAEFIFADGMPLVWLSRLLPGDSIPERVTGADLMPRLCEAAAHSGLNIMIVGGGPGVAQKAAGNLLEKHPDIRIAGILCPDFGFERSPEKTSQVIEEINSVAPDLLFFCVGTPKSEKWLHDHFDQLEFGVALSVGAAVDFLAGNINRAPRVIRDFGLEWFWRLCQEPRRLWKRYLVRDSVFLYYGLKELLSNRYRTPPPDVSN